ncbi:Hint domain-containing protein [Palleronia sp. KMU-117]|uniref:Hint domain-containing protein n=1 Tax=Palleronia sp. KMU-117 TaxID=3434108 RepID=UPI003D751279
MGTGPGGGRLTIIGPETLAISPGDAELTANYIVNRLNVTWSVQVISDGVLTPADYTVTISETGPLSARLSVVLTPGVNIPAGTSLQLVIGAVRAGGGGGNSDTLNVTVSLPPGVVPCFVAGTLIRTARGEVPVEELMVGDLVLTGEGWPAPIRWIGERRLSGAELRAAPHLRPVTIRKDAFGPGAPYRDLRVSPQHRIALTGWRAELLFGAPAVLAHAVHLVDDAQVLHPPAPEDGVRYVHFCLQDHDLVWANGLSTESLLLGEVALASYDAASLAELAEIFPDLAHPDAGRSCLPCIGRREALCLLDG